MEYVILVLTLPLVVYALLVTFRERRPPAPTAAAAASPAEAAPVSAPVRSSGMARRPYPWLVVGALLAAAAVFFSPLFTTEAFLGNVVRLMVLSRYGLLTGLLLVGLVPLGLRAAPSLLGNLFVLRAWHHLFHVAWMSVLVGAMVVVVCGVEELNAPLRYNVHAPAVPGVGRDLIRAAAVLVLCLPVLLACLRCTREATLPRERWRPVPWVLSGLAGLAAGFFLLVLAAAVQPMLLSPNLSAPVFPLQGLGEWAWRQLGSPHTQAIYPLGDAVTRLLASAPGYTRIVADDGRQLAAGHAQLTLAMAAVLLVYLFHYLVVRARGFRAGHVSRLPALYDVLFLLLLLGFFLQGAAFALDLYWVPASLGVALLALALYWGFNTDHLFSLGWTGAAGGVKAAARPAAGRLEGGPPTLQDAAAGWARQGRRTLVAVAASGGGIQAAAWTARALVGLHQRYGEAFTGSIRLLSAVSGGSVGAMYCLDAWPPPAAPGPAGEWAPPPPDAVPPDDSVCGRAMASSLEATAWGLVFPDLLRVVAPFLVDRTDDRGTRIEQAWRAGLRRPDIRLTDWADAVLRGEMPVPVFNATVVETGQRFLASPVLGPPSPGPAAAQPRQLLELYPGAAPLVSTAVRLSATFPFVSPICRPEWSGKEPWPQSASYHFADGGYVDNEGMVTLIQWLTALLDPAYLAERPFDRILLVRLMPFPSAAPLPAGLGRGWVYSTVGPLLAVQNVRTASQQERNDLAVGLFTAAARQGVEVRSAELRFELPSALTPPLSWMLTDPQKAAVDDAWRFLLAHDPDGALKTIDGWFP
ncbi:MAG TPA: hypothetical protein VFE78_08390 [Gemmataceae bacterium]|jgi:hypothetical protein|nr:hypothetical protein [Gemmataceae bacterium]